MPSAHARDAFVRVFVASITSITSDATVSLLVAQRWSAASVADQHRCEGVDLSTA
jgi:hypothetical protein